MIAFEDLDTPGLGRLGNQLFQYAYLRATARRLGVPFHCGPWIGDRVLRLDDGDERAARPAGITRRYVQPPRRCGWVPEAANVEDGTAVRGFFQSERYFAHCREAVRRWFRPRDAVRDTVDRWLARGGAGLDPDGLGRAATLSLRLGRDYRVLRRRFPLYPRAWYGAALAELGAHGPVVVFSDRPRRARRHLAGLDARLGRPLHFVEGLAPIEALHLMGRARDHVLTNSTFSWWGAWLAGAPDKRVVAPREWFRPGSGYEAAELYPRAWRVRPALARGEPPHPYWAARDVLVRQARRVRRRLLGSPRRAGPDVLARPPLAETADSPEDRSP